MPALRVRFHARSLSDVCASAHERHRKNIPVYVMPRGPHDLSASLETAGYFPSDHLCLHACAYTTLAPSPRPTRHGRTNSSRTRSIARSPRACACACGFAGHCLYLSRLRYCGYALSRPLPQSLFILLSLSLSLSLPLSRPSRPTCRAHAKPSYPPSSTAPTTGQRMSYTWTAQK
jgi:hypothetical protein